MRKVTVTLPAPIWKAVSDILGDDMDSEHYEEFPEFLEQIETARDAIEAALNNDPFGHVEDEFLRGVLNGDVSEDALCTALNMTADALEADIRADESGMESAPPIECINAREEAYQNAVDAWNEDGDMMESLEYLKRFWSV